jgi:hypothetical protein
MQWRPFLPKKGGLMYMDISGHPPIPTSSKQFVGNLLVLAVPNFLGHFEGLKKVISRSGTSIIVKGFE